MTFYKKKLSLNSLSDIFLYYINNNQQLIIKLIIKKRIMPNALSFRRRINKSEGELNLYYYM